MKQVKVVTILCCLCISSLSIAANTLNELNYCLALIKLVDKRIVNDEKKYTSNNVNQIRQGLTAYTKYVEVEIVRPGLLSFHRGNVNSVELSEKLYLKYQLNFMEHLDERYSEQRLIHSYAPAIETCAQESLPKNDISYGKMINALDTIRSIIKTTTS